MRRTLALALVVSFTALAAVAQTTSQDESLTALRDEMQKARADMLAKNVTLSADQAAKFWPVFEKYQKEQNTIIDAQLRGIQEFVDKYRTLDDAGALTLMNAHLDRDAKMFGLRKKWLAEFQKVLPTKIAVRVMQIDRRLSLIMQSDLAAHIPLVQ